MSDKSAVYIVKLFKEDGTNFFHASSTFLTSEGGEFRRLDLLFVDVEDNRGFQATFDETMLKKSKETTRSDDDFEELAKSAFATSSTEFSFSLDSGKTNLMWKRGEKRRNIKVKLADIPVTPVEPSEAHNTIFNQIVQLNIENMERLKVEKTRKSDLMDNLRKTQRCLEKLTDEKNQLEQKMFGQFIPILHAKQDKIRHLTKEIEDLEKRLETRKEKVDPDEEMNSSDELEMEDVVHNISSDDDDEVQDPANRSIDSQNFLNL